MGKGGEKGILHFVLRDLCGEGGRKFVRHL